MSLQPCGQTENDDILTDEDIARILKLRVKQTQELLRQKKIPGKKVGRYWRCPRSIFFAWLEGKEIKNT